MDERFSIRGFPSVSSRLLKCVERVGSINLGRFWCSSLQSSGSVCSDRNL